MQEAETEPSRRSLSLKGEFVFNLPVERPSDTVYYLAYIWPESLYVALSDLDRGAISVLIFRGSERSETVRILENLERYELKNFPIEGRSTRFEIRRK